MKFCLLITDGPDYAGHPYLTRLWKWTSHNVAFFDVPDPEIPAFLDSFPGTKPTLYLKAYTIPGWMDESELRWLNHQAKSHPLIAEIGSWQGRSTTALVEDTGAKIYAIDSWRGCLEIKLALQIAGQIPTGREPDYEEIYEDFQRNLSHEIDAGRVVPIRSKSRAAAELFPDRHFDMVFIDAEHTYTSCLEDIQVWQPKVRPGGLLCGHDYSPVSWPGVCKAVHEVIKTPLYLVEDTSIWFTYTEESIELKASALSG